MVWSKMAKIIKKGKIKYILIAVLLIGILFIGNKLREYSYSEVPNPGETNDEYSFAWLGISLLKEGKPIAWSGIPGYKVTDYQKINVDGIFDSRPEKPDFAINSPWFDHPPLFGLLVGGYAYTKGIRNFVDASVIVIRRPMLKIALLTSILIFILGWKLFSRGIGLLASLLYSTIPLVVISSRLALAENGYVPLFLLSAVFASFYFDDKFCKKTQKLLVGWFPYLKNILFLNILKKSFWISALFFASIAVLFKISAIAIIIFLVVLSIIYSRGKERKKLLRSAILAGIIPLVIFAIYGAYYDWGVFINILRTNSNRFFGVGPEIIFTLINRSVVTKSFNDGWLLLSWISVFMLAFGQWKKNFGSTFILSAIFSYLFIFVLFGSEPYGWYRFPFFPFLILALSKVLFELFRKREIYLFSFLMMLPIGTALNRLIGVTDFQPYVRFLRVSTVIIFLLFAMGLFINNKKLLLLKRVIMLSLFFFAVWISVKLIYFYNIDSWYFAV